MADRDAPGARMDEISELLTGRRWRVLREVDVQGEIARVLDDAGIAFRREVKIGRGRVDFLVEGGIVLEVKLKGGIADLVAQVCRYAEADGVTGVLAVVTSRRLTFNPATIEGRPIAAVLLPTL